MSIFHEGEPLSRKVIEGFSINARQASEFAATYAKASQEEKAVLLQNLSLPTIPDISLCLTNPFYRATCGIDNELYETDQSYRTRVNELISSQLTS